LRARSDEAKRRRRQEILATADQLLRANGLDKFTMNKLATACGLAKGTLYLYFATREELMLNLYINLNEAWIERFLAVERRSNSADYEGICIRFYKSFTVDELLVEFAALAACTLEPHVPQIAWIAAKKSQGKIAKRLGGMFCQKLKCQPAAAQRLAWAFIAGLSGAQQRAIDVGGRADLPADLLQLSGFMSSRDVFLNLVLPLAPFLRKQDTTP